MTGTSPTFLDRRGNQWLQAGGAFGIAGGISAFVLPVLLLEIARQGPGGIAAADTRLIAYSGWLVLAGAVLLFLSFFAYRWGYSLLRRVDPRYWIASGLCILGSSGLLLLIVAGVLVTGNQSSLVNCVQGPYSQVYSCIQGQTPLGAYTAIVGFWLGWIGAIGIVIGLGQAATRFRSVLYAAGGVLYAITIVLLVGPLTGLFVSLPIVEQLLLLAPAFAVAAPLLVLLARPTLPAARSASGS